MSVRRKDPEKGFCDSCNGSVQRKIVMGFGHDGNRYADQTNIVNVSDAQSAQSRRGFVSREEVAMGIDRHSLNSHLNSDDESSGKSQVDVDLLVGNADASNQHLRRSLLEILIAQRVDRIPTKNALKCIG